jgi:DNA helicase HerA-like ATPase
MENLRQALETIAQTDIFEVAKQPNNFVGNPFKIDYDKTSILTCDDWKHKVGGIAQGCFLLAFYENDFGEEDVNEILLLRALKPCPIPSDNNVISSRIEHYKEQLKTAGVDRQIDQFTRFEFSCSGLECSILGTFYKNKEGGVEFGADVENFYSPHLYKVYKASGKYLQYIVNIRDADGPLMPESNFQIGTVRYSSSRKEYSPNNHNDEKVYMHTKDILGKRTALFGMTRTGKSNTVKMLIEATEELSGKSVLQKDESKGSFEDNLTPFYANEVPKQPVGQIIFDINGEYANKNLQDGTAIFEKYQSKVTRFSVLEKAGFKVLKINFYTELVAGLELIRGYFKQFGKQSDYVEDFLGVNLEEPDDQNDYGKLTSHNRKVAAYKCCLKQAGFSISGPNKLFFQGVSELDNQILTNNTAIVPKDGITYEQAIIWFSQVWKNYETWDYLKKYESKEGKPWADNELKALLRFVSQYRSPGEKNKISSFIKLKPLVKYHSSTADKSFEDEIENLVRTGKIVIVDLSQGDPEIQNLYSEKICRTIFNSSMNHFIEAKPNNFIQFYFEEAHNLFPKKDDKDLSQIYNRIAKEGAKLNLGMIYATQEVSSISSNILKNTQNWFIAHLNNDDEVKELRKFYDFSDFADSLIRFSAASDKGFVRMKTYSNPFVVPIQVELFK